MKTKKNTHLFTCFLILIIVLGCQKDGSSDSNLEQDMGLEQDIDQEFEPNFINGIAAKETGISEMPYFVQHENGEVMFLTAEDGVVTGAQYHFAQDQFAQLWFNEGELPNRMLLSDGNENVIILFENYREQLVDLAIVYNDDFIILRNQELEQLGIENGLSNKENSTSCFFSPLRFSCIMRAAGLVLSGASCIASTFTLPATFGGTYVLAAVACGGATAGAYSLFVDEDNRTSSTAGAMANVIGCSTVLAGNVTTGQVDCMAVATDIAAAIADYGQSVLFNASDMIQATLGSLYSGYGDVKFTLSWYSSVDMDLYVAEPNGEIIYYGNSASVTGGLLDVDNTTGYGTENIFWPTDKAPVGTYTVWVEMYSGNSPTDFTVKPELPGAYQPVVFGDLSEDGQRFDVGTYTVTNSGGKQVVTFNKSPIKTIASPAKGKYSKKSTN